MKIFKLTTILLLSLIYSIFSNGQDKKEIEELYKDANSYFYFEDYDEAVALYLQVYNQYTDNYNLSFRIGFCYLNIPGYKSQAIPYLEKASAHTTNRYNDQSILETKAPIESIFYLGNAYFVNNQIDKALKEYSRFKEVIKSDAKWNMTYFNHQIATAKNSEIIQSIPVNFLRNNLGEPVNDRFANYNPVLSGDGNTLAFTTKRRFYQAIYIQRKVDNRWGTPVNITLDLQVDGNCATLSLSDDGNELYLFKDDNHDGNIYVTRFVNGKWMPMKLLNENINTKYYETHACINKEGDKLFFTSNRKGGYGDLDIYVSERDSGDNWGVAKNLGANVNTSMNENTPFVTSEGNILYFSSEAHNNMGGYDIFFSQKKSDDTWSKPINIGYPINTTDDDQFYFPIGDGSYALMALFDKDGYGEQDIYQVEIFVPKYQKTILTKSELFERTIDKKLKTLVIDTINVRGIALLDPGKSNQVNYLDPLKRYKLFYQGKGYDLRDQAEQAKLLLAQIQSNKSPDNFLLNRQQALPQVPETGNEDFATIEQRMQHLKHAADTSQAANINKSHSLNQNAELSDDQKKVSIAETNYLPEILLALAKNGSQENIAKLLQRNWQVPTSLLKLRINQLTHSVDSTGNTKELLKTFTKFIDLVGSTDYIAQQKQTRRISEDSENSSFTYFINKIITKATPELSALLGKIYQDNPDISSFEKFLKIAEKEHPDTFRSHIPELVRLMADIGVETYVSLPEEHKLLLYENVSQKDESKPFLWIILIVVFGIIGIGGYLYLRKK